MGSRISIVIPAIFVLAYGGAVTPVLGAGKMEGTLHNLSRSGPGEIKSDTETQSCVFCHAAHTARDGQTPLWNRRSNGAVKYEIYKSATMKQAGRQPDGASKLCLSCHDGTIALGEVLNRKGNIPMRGVGARGEIPGSRRSNLGTNLSGGHPISIDYSDQVARGRNLDRGKVIGIDSSMASVQAVPKKRLDESGKVQCTSCHDPHEDNFYQEDRVPHFWRSPTVSEVCESCHYW